jgi:hypothetical protein
MTDDKLAVWAGTMGEKMTNDRLQMTNCACGQLGPKDSATQGRLSVMCHLSSVISKRLDAV